MIKASCHCGNVQLQFEQLPESLTRCNCSICRRYAASWIYFQQDEVQIICKQPTKAYIWGDKEIAFHHCENCGCVTHYSSLPNKSHTRTAVNANLLPVSTIQDLKVRTFAGAAM